MSYLATPAATHYPWHVRLLFYLPRRRFVIELKPAGLWGHTLLALVAMYEVLDRNSSPLNPSLRSLVQVRVSQINWCFH